MSCLKKLHKTTTPTPHRKTPHHHRLVHPGLIYIPLASRVHLPLLLYVRPESSWGIHPEGGRAFKNGQVRPLHSGLSEWPRGRGRRYRNQTGIYTRHTYSWSYILFLTLFTIPRCTATVNLVTSPGLRHWESAEASLMGVSEKMNLCNDLNAHQVLHLARACLPELAHVNVLFYLHTWIFCSLSHLLTRLHELDASSIFKKT